MTRSFARLAALGFTLASAAVLTLPPSAAQDLPSGPERILSFQSEITVSTDGSMQVKETIKVRAAGEQIRRGIYRDFPTDYRDRLGNRYVVGFELLDATRDGQAENYRVESRENGNRVYLGRKSVLLSPGEYTYSITYRTTRQLGFFPDHDELYWNVTGNGWVFPIERATAVVNLPAGIRPAAILLDGYTGPQGSLGKAFEGSVDPQGRPTFTTTKPLGPAEGLTIVVSWPKGFIAPPTREMKIQWFLEDNRSTLVGLAGLLLLLGYYFFTWVRVGRDPERGVIMPLYAPPAKVLSRRRSLRYRDGLRPARLWRGNHQYGGQEVSEHSGKGRRLHARCAAPRTVPHSRPRRRPPPTSSSRAATASSSRIPSTPKSPALRRR